MEDLMPAPSGKTTIVDNLSSRLSELGIELPEPPTPLGAISHKQMEFFVNANKPAARSATANRVGVPSTGTRPTDRCGAQPYLLSPFRS